MQNTKKFYKFLSNLNHIFYGYEAKQIDSICIFRYHNLDCRTPQLCGQRSHSHTEDGNFYLISKDV